MAKSDKIRNYGLIPERRHDAFLLALLLALALNAAFFAIQAIIPKLSSLLQLLAPEAALQQEEEEALPFILVDPNLLDEPVDDEAPDAESLVDREARQAEPPPPELPEDKPYVEEGVDELQSMPEGNPGLAEASPVNAPESPESTPSPEQTPAEQADQADQGESEPMEPMEQIEPVEEIPEQPEPLPEPEPEPVEPPPSLRPPPEPEPEPAPEPIPEPVEEFIPPPPAEAEPVQEELPPTPLQPEPAPAPPEMPEMIDLAMLPVTPDGLYAPQPQQPVPEWQERPQEQVDEYELFARQQYEALQQQQQQVRPQPPQPEQPRQREGRRQPTFRQIGGNAPSAPSRAGGAPRHRNLDSRINLLDSDPNMKYLAHKYADYMRNMVRLLQESLNREVLLQPVGYTVGQAKLIFTIAADGTLGAYRTVYPSEGDRDYVRITSEQTLVNAGPFEPPTPEMLQDPIFKQMSLTVNLY